MNESEPINPKDGVVPIQSRKGPSRWYSDILDLTSFSHPPADYRDSKLDGHHIDFGNHQRVGRE